MKEVVFSEALKQKDRGIEMISDVELEAGRYLISAFVTDEEGLRSHLRVQLLDEEDES